jgi:hypothetical protein
MWWWLGAYLVGMPLGVWLAKEAFADLRPCASPQGQRTLGVCAALGWPVLIVLMLAGMVARVADVLKQRF